MLPRSTPQIALLMFHNAIGHAYGEVTSLGWHGWLTEGDIRRIEEDAITLIRKGEALPETLHKCDPGPAIDDAEELARAFFRHMRAHRARRPVVCQ